MDTAQLALHACKTGTAKTEHNNEFYEIGNS